MIRKVLLSIVVLSLFISCETNDSDSSEAMSLMMLGGTNIQTQQPNKEGEEPIEEKSTNANLDSLITSHGDLFPDFVKTVTNYTTSIAFETTSITITPTADDTNATITVDGTLVNSGQVSDPINLIIGQNNIEIEVTAEDLTTQKTYIIVATREDSDDPSSNANLGSLTISSGIINPIFDHSRTVYYVQYGKDSGVTSVTVTPVLQDENATIKVNNQSVGNGQESQDISITNGAVIDITIEVTAEDTVTIKNYYIHACKASKIIHKTGQTIKYATGDDGDLEIGIPIPNPRFTDNGDETITDNMTLLMWSKNMNLDGLEDWRDAVSSSNSMILSGYSDWRLPNINELRTLYNYGYAGEIWEYLDDYFTNVAVGYYWSSTTMDDQSEKAWVYGLGGDSPSLSMHIFDLEKGDLFDPVAYFVPVRGTANNGSIQKTGQTTCYDHLGNVITCGDFPAGQDADENRGVAWPSPRFVDNGDGTIFDNLTGLMWAKTPDTTTRNWNTAITYANGSTLAGMDDWRLPNINELISLIDAGETSLSLPSGHPFTNIQTSSKYWTSTTCPDETSHAFSISFITGFNVIDNEKTAPMYVLIVR